MHCRIRAQILCLFGAILLVAPTLCAQVWVDELPSAFEEDIDSWNGEYDVDKSPFYLKRFTDTYAKRIEAGQIYSVASEMVEQFEALDWNENKPSQQKILNQLQRFLQALKIALHSPGIEGTLDEKAEQDTFSAALERQNFGVHTLQMEPFNDSGGREVQGYFKDTPDSLLLYEWDADGDKLRPLLTEEQISEWRLLQNALTNLTSDQLERISAANVLHLRNAVVRWENFLDKGYSQMPWESLVNGLLIRAPEFGPPSHQWSLMHPTVGLEMSVNPIDETRIEEAMHVEVLGHIWYRGKRLHDYWGFSATVSLRRDGIDPGIGAMLHIKRNWNLGATWHDVEEDPFLFFSLDLFNFANEKVPKYVKKYLNLQVDLGPQ